VPSFLLTKLIGKHLEDIRAMGAALLIGGVIMWIIDTVYSREARWRTTRIDDSSLMQAIWIGGWQTLSALFPGTSRSMATIAAGQTAGMSRPVALEFSFLLSMPTMVAATGYDLLKSMTAKGPNAVGATHIDAHGAALLLIGTAVSFVVAYAVVAWFMHWVRRRGFSIFAIYRILAGAAVIWYFAK
jgi:undecaprenyl-diphosphatase